MPRALHEQVVVITGASSGIGRETALLFGEQQASVVLAARNETALRDVAEMIEQRGGRAHVVVTDVSEWEQVERLAQEAVNHFGRIDTWVNNAAVSIYGRLDQISEADGRRLFDVNFWGVVNGSLAALPYLLGGGALINVGSELPDGDLPLQGMYSSSKHAVKGFTDALRTEVVGVDQAPVSITLIQPALDPMLVAQAILRAATEGAREVRVAQDRLPRPGLEVAAMAPAARPMAKHA
jgi:NAD(P)-dependent dehydrogenase (short-subunit alcohol dehydrogenase family)